MARRSKGAVSINPRSAQNMSTRQADFSKKKGKVSPVKAFGAIGALICIVASLFIQLPGLDVSGTRMFGIFLAAILLWVTEAVPLAGDGGPGHFPGGPVHFGPCAAERG